MGHSALIGREEELALLGRAATANRVVAVTGSPGVGKSALAAALAGSRPSMSCSLAHAVSAEDVCRELASALGIGVSPSLSPHQVARALARPGRDLVILDDADQAGAALTTLLPEWSREAKRVHFVVTSRSRLRVPGAQRFVVGPLALAPWRATEVQVIERAPAVRLFVRAARNVASTYRLRAATAPIVADIVRRLEGNPLALELCASRVVVLGERELLDLLSRSLDVLDEGRAGLPGRSLRSAFALSWDRLAEAEARFLAACSCFRGSFDLDAATAVAIGESGPRARLAAATMLDRLEEASLVRVFEPDDLPGVRRYVVSASLGAYAAEKLEEQGNRRDVERRHALHFSSFTTLAPKLSLEVLSHARADLEQAVAWAISSSATSRGSALDLAGRLLLAVAPLALARGPLAPFLERASQVLARAGLPRAIAAELHLTRGLALVFQGRRDEALVDLEDARRLARLAKAGRTEILASSKIGLIIGLKGQFAKARRCFEQATARLGELPSDPWLGGIVRKDHANVLAEEGQNDDAVAMLARARDLLHAAGDVREEGVVLMMLGSRLVDDGHLEDARRDCTAAVELLRSVGDHRSQGWSQVLLAIVDAEEGDLARARGRLESAIMAFRTIGDGHTEGLALGYLGNVALEQGALADAEDAYRDGRLRLAEAGDHGSEAMCIAGSAVVHVARGRLAAARDGFAVAAKMLDGDGRAARREAVAILASLLGPAAGADAAPRENEELRSARRIVARFRERARRKGDAGVHPSEAEVVMAPDGSWIRSAEGRVVRIARAGAVRRIVARLVAERMRRPGTPLALAALVAAGWPEERIEPSAARNRLHVVIARLRRSGLERILGRDGDGYLLDPGAPARLAEEGERPDL